MGLLFAIFLGGFEVEGVWLVWTKFHYNKHLIFAKCAPATKVVKGISHAPEVSQHKFSGNVRFLQAKMFFLGVELRSNDIRLLRASK